MAILADESPAAHGGVQEERGSNMQVRELPRDGMRELLVTLPLGKAASLIPTAEHLTACRSTG